MQLRLLCVVGVWCLIPLQLSFGQTLVPSLKAIDVTVPDGFYQEGGSDADAVAVGSKNGRMLATCLKHGCLYFFNLETMAADPWCMHYACDSHGKRIGNLHKIAVSCDGTICAIRSDDHAIYRYYWPRAYAPITELNLERISHYAQKGHWEPVVSKDKQSIRFVRIAVGNSDEIWGIDNHGHVYHLECDCWIAKPFDKKLVWISVGFDGTMRAITNQGILYAYSNDQWIPINGVPRLTKIAVATKDLMWGIDEDQAYMLWRYEQGVWKRVRGKNGVLAKGFKDVSVNPAGTVFLVDLAGRLYANGESGVPVGFIKTRTDIDATMCKKVKGNRTTRRVKR